MFAGHLQICKIVQSQPALASLGCRCAAGLAVWTVCSQLQTVRHMHGSHKRRLKQSTVWMGA